jgi:hypothetical protein
MARDSEGHSDSWVGFPAIDQTNPGWDEEYTGAGRVGGGSGPGCFQFILLLLGVLFLGVAAAAFWAMHYL